MTLPVPLQDIKVSKWFNIHLNKKRNFFGTVSTLATFFFHRPNLSSISIDRTAYIVKLCRNPQEVPHVNFAVLLWKDMAFNLHACTCRSHFQNAIWPQTLKKKKRKERKKTAKQALFGTSISCKDFVGEKKKRLTAVQLYTLSEYAQTAQTYTCYKQLKCLHWK